MAQHNSYWSCSKFADIIRGQKKPAAGTMKQWDSWRKAAKASSEFRYWLAEEGLDHLQDFVTWPIRKLYNIKYYINNRFVVRTHALRAHSRDLPPGVWHDLGNRFLPCMFNELVDFVEIELAWANIAWDKAARTKFKAPWYAMGWFKTSVWRSAECGLDHLNWQCNLRVTEEYVEVNDPTIGDLTPQAIDAREILELYEWWTVSRPNREDVYEISGWNAMDHSNFDMNDAKRKALDLMHTLEKKYDDEDTEMMCRLIRIRHRLWT